MSGLFDWFEHPSPLPSPPPVLPAPVIVAPADDSDDMESVDTSAINASFAQALGDVPFDPDGLRIYESSDLSAPDSGQGGISSQVASRGVQDDPQSAMAAMQYIILLTQASPPVTELLAPIAGDFFGAANQYKTIYRNLTPRPVRIQAFVIEWGNPGEGLKLAVTPETSDVGKVDVLSNTANGKSEAIGVILRPGESLYGSVENTTQPLTAGTSIRARIFDPQVYLTGLAK